MSFGMMSVGGVSMEIIRRSTHMNFKILECGAELQRAPASYRSHLAVPRTACLLVLVLVLVLLLFLRLRLLLIILHKIY